MDVHALFRILVFLILNSWAYACKDARIMASKSQSPAEVRRGGVRRSKRAPPETNQGFNEICDRGQFVNLEEKRCDRCPGSDHYMPDTVHSQLRCYPCGHARPNSPETDLVSCTSTTDTIIGCKAGHFLQLAALYDDKLVKCLPCTKCSETNPPSFEIKLCGKSVDTVCCPRLDMIAVQKEGEYDYECASKTTVPFDADTRKAAGDHRASSHSHRYEAFRGASSGDASDSHGSGKKTCDAGQFLKVDELTKEEACKLCPNNTFITDKNHTWLKCKSCKVRPHNPDEIMGCPSNKDVPLVLACRNNKYLHFPVPKDSKLRECRLCTNCVDHKNGPYEGRPCSNSINAECCPEQNMIFENEKCREIELTSPDPPYSSTPEKDDNGGDGKTISTTSMTSPNGSVRSTDDDKSPTKFIIIIVFLVFVILVLIVSHIPCVRNKIIQIGERACSCQDNSHNQEERTEMNSWRTERQEDDQ